MMLLIVGRHIIRVLILGISTPSFIKSTTQSMSSLLVLNLASISFLFSDESSFSSPTQTATLFTPLFVKAFFILLACLTFIQKHTYFGVIPFLSQYSGASFNTLLMIISFLPGDTTVLSRAFFEY